MYTLTLCPLFNKIPKHEIPELAAKLNVSMRTVDEKTLICHEGVSAPFVGFLVSGAARLLHSTEDGRFFVIGSLDAGSIFGLIFSLRNYEKMPLSVEATERSSYFTFDIKAAFNDSRILLNLVELLSEKNLRLNRRIAILSHSRIRDKILAYLNDLPSNQIPLNRTQLAAFLCSDRSALSRELRAMQNEGILILNKRTFTLTNPKQW